MINKLGLGYEKIHSCPKDCMLFWGPDDGAKESCTICKSSRWESKDDGVPDGSKKIPAKVLRYFPLQPRLQRLFRSSKTSKSMRWHDEGRIKDGLLRHPTDATAWKEFDSRYPSFSSDPRSVRLGLASDGFNPFRTMSTTYSTWPVVIVVYNMEPWNCMKASSSILSMIIPCEKGPGNDIDVYLKPLIEELKVLWQGVPTFDFVSNENFSLEAALLWTINDFPAYANLSGWSTKGQFACPKCHSSTHSKWLKHGRKFSYTGHRRWLEPTHPYRFQKELFDGMEDLRMPPVELSGVEIERQMDAMAFVYGKMSTLPRKRQQSEQPISSQKEAENAHNSLLPSEENFLESEDECDGTSTEIHGSTHHLWKKRSIFFDLPYWKHNVLRHNLDVMHIEKNVCDNIISTLLNIDGKGKDNLQSRLDLRDMGLRRQLHPITVRGKTKLPQATYSFDKNEKDIFLKLLKNLKVPDGYLSNISRCVNIRERKLLNMKSHDGHVLMHDLLPVALQATMRKLSSRPVVAVISELSRFFKMVCSNILNPDELDELASRSIKIICYMEMIFPPSFFTIMVHLIVHLAEEAKLGGPVSYRWMYPIERYLSYLKGLVKNKACPEGSISEGYIANECLTFASRYFDNVETCFNRPVRNNEGVEHSEDYLFQSGGRVLGSSRIIQITDQSLAQAHRYVMLHHNDIPHYQSIFLDEKRNAILPSQASQNMENKWILEKFGEWLTAKVPMMMTENCSEELIAIARGPRNYVRRFNSYLINGFRFHTRDVEHCRRTQNSGVVVDVQGKPFFGILTDIYELNYSEAFKVVLFKCDWVDVNGRMGLQQTKNGCTKVNLSRLIHTGSNLKDDPFIFASQARQVFYVQDPIKSCWHYAICTMPRDLYNTGSSVSGEDIEGGAPSYNHCIPTSMTISAADTIIWARAGIVIEQEDR